MPTDIKDKDSSTEEMAAGEGSQGHWQKDKGRAGQDDCRVYQRHWNSLQPTILTKSALQSQ